MPDQTAGLAFAASVELYTACRDGDPLVQASAYEALWRYLFKVALQVVGD
jgi:hypothetical protein